MYSPTVSILIPVYNVEETLLRRCVSSCLAQTLDGVEIIVVDDGSKEETAEICDEFADNPQVKVIHQPNKGLSGARNTAFYAASGEYITFLDGDDYLDEDALETAYKKAKEKGVQAVFFDYRITYGDNSREYHSFDEDRAFDGDEVKDLRLAVLDFDSHISQAFAKLIDREFLLERNIIHNEVLRQGAEGFVFNMALFSELESAYYIRKCSYNYVYNASSITHTHDKTNDELILKCFEYIKNSYPEQEITSAVNTRLLHVIVTTGVSGYFNPSYKAKYGERKRGFAEFLKEPSITEALKSGNGKKLGFLKKFLVRCAKIKWFLPYYFAGKLRRKKQKSN